MDIREIEILFKDPSIHKFAVSLCRNNSLAEDLVMDVVTRLIEKAEKLPDDLNLKAYAITAIKNRFVDNHRRTRKEETGATTEGGSLFDQLIDEAASSAIEAPIELQQALNKLNEACFLRKRCTNICIDKLPRNRHLAFCLCLFALFAEFCCDKRYTKLFMDF